MADTGRLTVHVLDTASGRPAAGLGLDLYALDGGGRSHLGHWQTNAEGRSDAPLLAGASLRAGVYEAVFDVASWRQARCEAEPGFYDSIPIRFRIDDAGAHTHLPLLLAPFGYSTYRGS